jgi:RNA polymerase sigma-70 factor (ECF subfamily)
MDAIGQILKKVRRTVVRRGAPVHDADDIVQEAFARMEAYARTHEVANEEAFLMRTAVNIGRDEACRRFRSPLAPSDRSVELIADAAPQPDEVLRARERLRRARAGLDQLDPLTRRCLLAQRLEGISYAQIAAREGLPVTTVEKRVARAVLFLMKWMDDW